MANPFSSFVSSLLPQKSSTSLSGGSSVMTPLQQFQSQAGAPKVQYPTTPKANATSVTTKQPTYIPSNSGATSTAPAQITPAKTSVSSPAAQSYVSSLTSSQPSYSSTAYTPPTATQTPTYQATTETPKESNPYLDYLKSSFNPDALNKAQETIKGYDTKLGTETQRLVDINSNIFGKTTAARHEYEKMLDTPGGTREGAQVSATQEGRRNNAELADLATQQNAQANSVSALTDARTLADSTYKEMIANGATLYEAEQAAKKAQQDALGEGFTLSAGQTRYDAQGNPIAGGNNTTSGNYVAGQDPTADAWIKYAQDNPGKINDIPDEYKNIVAQGLASTPKSQSATTQNTLSVIDSLLSDTADLDAITGVRGILPVIPGTPAALTENQFNQLQGILKLDNRQQLKGSGAISDFEFKILGEAATALGKNLSKEQVVDELTKLKQKLTGNYPIPSSPASGDVWKAPDGTEYEFKDGGWESDFSSVGNTSASIPSSSRLAKVNNNPGNLKFVGQNGATLGEGGFAKFKTVADGIKALENQVKLDASRGLTLAELITKYAPPSENDTQKYINEVAIATGSSPLAPASSINLTNLVKAIAKKESSTKIT